MARDYLEIGPTPDDESCVQAPYNTQHDRDLARLECDEFITDIIDTLGQPPEDAHLATRSFPHDFGSYLTVVCYYDDESQAAIDYAFKCESQAPINWSERAKQSLAKGA